VVPAGNRGLWPRETKRRRRFVQPEAKLQAAA